MIVWNTVVLALAIGVIALIPIVALRAIFRAHQREQRKGRR